MVPWAELVGTVAKAVTRVARVARVALMGEGLGKKKDGIKTYLRTEKKPDRGGVSHTVGVYCSFPHAQ